MDKLDNIKMMNDLVLRTERGELQWLKTEYAGKYVLNNSNGKIYIGKLTFGDIVFKIIGSKGDVVTDNIFKLNDPEDYQIYKVSSVLWSLVKDLSIKSKVDFQEILDFLEEDEGERR